MLSSDVQDLYNVLGALELLIDEEMRPGVLLPTSIVNLERVVRNCNSVFAEIKTRLQEFQEEWRHGQCKDWEKLKWTFRKHVWEELRKRLTEQKLSLSLAISVAN